MKSNNSRVGYCIKNSKFALFFSILNFVALFFSRKVFLECLGAEVLGLNTTLLNLLQFINLAEMGISTAIASTLYKPISQNEVETINEIVSVQGWFYRRVAMIVIGVAIVLMLFFPLIFREMQLPMWYAYATFIALLFSSLLGYYTNYKQIILSATQQEYLIITSYRFPFKIVKVVVQILAIYYFSYGYIWWIALEIIFAIIASITLNRTIRRVAPYLKTDLNRGREYSAKHDGVLKKIKQLFFHKIAQLTLTQVQPLIIYSFTSLVIVAYYGNYLYITTGLTVLIYALFNGMGASVGNLVAFGDKDKVLSIFKELFSIRMLLVSSLCITIYFITPHFITLWVGADYIMDTSTLLLMLVAFFIVGIRCTVDEHLAAYGLFYDVWAPVTETVLNIIISIIFGSLWGLNGVLIGAVLSSTLLVLGWKPYFLFTRGFKIAYSVYLKLFIGHIMAVFALCIAIKACNIDFYQPYTSYQYLNLICNAGVIFFVSALLLFCLLYSISDGMRHFFHRVKSIVLK